MPKSEFDRDKLLKLYDVANMSDREIDAVAKKEGNVKLGLALHKLKKETTSKTYSAATKKEQIQQRIETNKIERQKAKESIEKSGHTMAVKVPLNKKPAKQTKPRATKPAGQSNGSTHKTYAERKKQTEKLQQYRTQLEVLVEEANERVDRLANMKKVQSRALDEARRTVPESRKSDELFTSNLRTESQIKRELSRVMAFLGDYTSLARGAEDFTEDLTSAGLFGGQYRANGGPGYDESVVDPEIGEKVFDIYHRVLEVEGGWSRVMGYFKANSGGLVEYGSTNLINAIYDMVTNFGTGDKATGKIIKRATRMIDDMIESYQEIATRQRSGVDYGFLGNDEFAEDRRNRWEWDMKKKGITL